MLKNIISLVCVALLWGGTNPFLKKKSKGITDIKANSKIIEFLKEVKYLLTNWEYILPMMLNQSGSLLYFLTLQNADLSLSVPIANSLTFIFTAICGWILGEKRPNYSTYLGMILIVIGTAMCCYDKYLYNDPT